MKKVLLILVVLSVSLKVSAQGTINSPENAAPFWSLGGNTTLPDPGTVISARYDYWFGTNDASPIKFKVNKNQIMNLTGAGLTIDKQLTVSGVSSFTGLATFGGGLKINSGAGSSASSEYALLELGNATGSESYFKVNGKSGITYAKEIKVMLPPFPDYVFEKDYSLMSLLELKVFISENGHLPGMPSAETVEQDGGVELGKLSVKLVEKIEELTLHAIEQQEAIDKLKKELEELKVKGN